MSISSYLRRDKILRFYKAVREEGWSAAFNKLRIYIQMQRTGHAPSAVANTPAGEATSYYLGPFWRDIAKRDGFHLPAAPALLSNRRQIAMIGDLNLPQCRKYRVEQLAELWATQKVGFGYAHYQDIPRAVGLLQDATHLMFYRTQNGPLNTMYLYEARRLRLPVLYDIDDPLFSLSAYETYENMKALPVSMKTHFMNEAPKYLDALNAADIVTVSTPGLRDHTRAYSPRPVYFRRNFADRATLAAADAALAALPQSKSGFTVAFASGSMGHEIDFALIQDDMIAFLDADPVRRLLILGHFDKRLLPVPLQERVETRSFSSYETYLAGLATADCAVMPLTDDIFNRCKSAVRVLDAAAVRVPCIVSTVSDMAQVVRDGQTGRVLQPGASWRLALEEMAADPSGTAAMGRRARQDIETTWGAQPGPPIIEADILDWVRT